MSMEITSNGDGANAERVTAAPAEEQANDAENGATGGSDKNLLGEIYWKIANLRLMLRNVKQSKNNVLEKLRADETKSFEKLIGLELSIDARSERLECMKQQIVELSQLKQKLRLRREQEDEFDGGGFEPEELDNDLPKLIREYKLEKRLCKRERKMHKRKMNALADFRIERDVLLLSYENQDMEVRNTLFELERLVEQKKADLLWKEMESQLFDDQFEEDDEFDDEDDFDEVENLELPKKHTKLQVPEEKPETPGEPHEEGAHMDHVRVLEIPKDAGESGDSNAIGQAEKPEQLDESNHQEANMVEKIQEGPNGNKVMEKLPRKNDDQLVEELQQTHKRMQHGYNKHVKRNMEIAEQISFLADQKIQLADKIELKRNIAKEILTLMNIDDQDDHLPDVPYPEELTKNIADMELQNKKAVCDKERLEKVYKEHGAELVALQELIQQFKSNVDEVKLKVMNKKRNAYTHCGTGDPKSPHAQLIDMILTIIINDDQDMEANEILDAAFAAAGKIFGQADNLTVEIIEAVNRALICDDCLMHARHHLPLESPDDGSHQHTVVEHDVAVQADLGDFDAFYYFGECHFAGDIDQHADLEPMNNDQSNFEE